MTFLSTLPARGATGCNRLPDRRWAISIHAPREGSDGQDFHVALAVKVLFLSTLPARGATYVIAKLREIVEFLSTLPARGATGRDLPRIERQTISIHAPREGSDAQQPLSG